LDDAPAILKAAIGEEDPLKLRSIFEVSVNRTTVLHQAGANRIELVADHGSLVAGEHSASISEIELELLDGSRDGIFSLARQLAAIVPLRLGVQSKSERGYRLLAGKERLAVKAEPIALSRDGDTATLFETIAAACIRQFRLNEDTLLVHGNPGSLHQARVALRRLRSALSMFKPMLDGPEFARFQRDYRGLATNLGTVRDVDVVIDKIDHDAALERLQIARRQRLDTVIETLNSDAVRTLMLDFVEWLSIGSWRSREDVKDFRSAPALVTAATVLDRLRRKVKRRGTHLARLDEADRHQVRIASKKLRYAAEFFSDLYVGKKAAHRQAAFLDTIEDLQSSLGHLNDLASGRALLRNLDIADADSILATGKKANRDRLLARAEEAHARLLDVKRFWRS
jgi:triphosphatase